MASPNLSSSTTYQPPVTTRRDFARSAEAMAEVGTPGFESYLPASTATKSEPILPAKGPNATPGLAQMSYEDNDFSFSDVVDFLNPFQHIPLVSSLYRAITGDEPVKPYTQVAGDILYGGAIGAAAGLALGSTLPTTASMSNAALEQETGKSAEKQLAENIFGTSAPVQVASLDTAPIASTALPHPLATKTPGRSQPLSDDEIKTKVQDGVRLAQEKMQQKKNYGGVMDVPASQRAAMLAETNGIDLAKNLYADPKTMAGGNAIRTGKTLRPIGAPKATPERLATASTPSTQQQPATTTTSPSAPTTTSQIASTTKPEVASTSSLTEKQELGLLMHENAQKAAIADKVGVKNALPSQLIQDMMLMALDKYQAANDLGSRDPTQPLTASR